MLGKVLNQYNNEVHRITKFKPVEAFNEKNTQDVKLNLLIQAKHARRYPDINTGDKVKIYIEKVEKKIWKIKRVALKMVTRCSYSK